MSRLKWFLVIVLVCPVRMCGQGQPSAHLPFSGCYRVVSQAWHPSNEDIKWMIPDRFQLRSEPAFGPGSELFAVRGVPASGNLTEGYWVWRPHGSKLWISLGTGLGGIRGTLKQSRTGEFVGKLKEWCDSRCGWKKRVGTIRIQQIDCTNP